jgi:hypothetical protein
MQQEFVRCKHESGQYQSLNDETKDKKEADEFSLFPQT